MAIVTHIKALPLLEQPAHDLRIAGEQPRAPAP
ncbi:hypothetical protein BLC1_1601 [Bifidobacterium animalis subsp. lactis BLC1]|uniref:Uncharacterized protein n=2 Tax=Bifidobacterium animalis subsp. lactis TaxID=302911 RepID=B8DVA3_BIFA0|nr:hypothetical protein BLA_0101 [Bifidobacterium animalis subsp. lactis AD011]AEK29554.1 hypothetical protein BALAC2494_01976 [Bifidobacterium animalis subsp. lactis CNCM I-2494]AGE31997.1 hypothetical protein BLC1_1601 [Bifidobacterium animalis subsp. lactis BLC1]AGO51617.1 hypothetical protein Bl12_0099 [Bifidobacterium animalis subsp. lactis Bl12]